MPSRRTTLGVSTAHNVRHSVVEGKLKRTVRGGKDPRDLHDKNFQKLARQKVIAFLAENRYPHEISVKTLSKQKEFFSAVWFILGAIDSELADLPPGEKSTEALVGQLKRLKYPYVPPKSTLQAFSASIYWPAMLGMLDWLVTRATMVSLNDKHKADLLKEGAWVGNAPIALIIAGDPGHIADQRRESERTDLFAAGYRAHVSGDERGDVFENLLQQRMKPMMEAEQQKNHRMRQPKRDCERIQEMEDLVLKRDRLMQEPDTVSEALSKLETVRKSQNATRSYMSDLKAQLSASQKKCADSEAHCRQLQIEIERDEREQDCVRSRIKAQPMQLKDLQAVRQDVRMATKVRLNKAALRDDAKKQLEAAREEYVEAVGDLERMTLKCNGQLARAKLHPACAAAANGIDYEVKVTSSTDAPVTLSVDLKFVQDAIQHRLAEIQDSCKRHQTHTRFRQRRLKHVQAELKTEEALISDQQRLGYDNEQLHRAAIAKARERNADMVQQATHQLSEEQQHEQEVEAELRNAEKDRAEAAAKLETELLQDERAANAEREAISKLANSMMSWSTKWQNSTSELLSTSQRVADKAQARMQTFTDLIAAGQTTGL